VTRGGISRRATLVASVCVWPARTRARESSRFRPTTLLSRDSIEKPLRYSPFGLPPTLVLHPATLSSLSLSLSARCISGGSDAAPSMWGVVVARATWSDEKDEKLEARRRELASFSPSSKRCRRPADASVNKSGIDDGVALVIGARSKWRIAADNVGGSRRRMLVLRRR